MIWILATVLMVDGSWPFMVKKIRKAIWKFCACVFWPQRRPKDYYDM